MTAAASTIHLKIGNPQVGDLISAIDLPTNTGEAFKTGDLTGKPTVFIFYPTEQARSCAQLLFSFRDAFEQFKTRNARIVGISLSASEQQKIFAAENQIPFPLLSDSKLQASSLYGMLRPKETQQTAQERLEFSAAVRVFLIAPDLCIAKIYEKADPATLPAQILVDIDALFFSEPARRIVSHAPVLMIPNAFPVELCQRLIQVWREQGSVDSGFMRQVDGKTVGLYDYSHKIRRDHFMKPSPELDAVKKFIGTRVLPKIQQAFNYEVSRFEDFRIASYDSARGGYFRPHRDNTTDGTAHRRFAMSLLLNDDYEGGTLRFPEFALHEYRPQVGGAVIFSCSLLHEATDVTAGQRFVLLSFFYGEKEAKIREEYNKRIGGDYKA